MDITHLNVNNARGIISTILAKRWPALDAEIELFYNNTKARYGIA